MKKVSIVLLLILTTFLFKLTVTYADTVDIYLFHSSVCVHCKEEKEFLKDIEKEYDINIHYYQVNGNKKNNELMKKVKEELDASSNYVPFTVIGSTSYTGFNSNVKNKIIKNIKNYNQNECDVVASIIKEKKDCIKTKKEKEKDFVIPLLGKINAKDISLPLVAIVIGLVDGFNPCAMWVLLFLLSMLIGMKNKKRMVVLGITFLITSAFMYYLFMASWLTIAISINKITILRILIALIAILGGLINLRRYLKSNETGCEVVKDDKRKKVFSKIKKFTTETSFILSMLGIMGVAISVNIIELACSAGLPLLFTQILALNNLNFIETNLLMLLYLLMFLLDDIIIFIIAVRTLNIKGISTKYSKYSHLVGGIIMLLIGILLILKPEWIMFNF